jgi:predicted metal-dependent phosphotriesterase family hydrolase
LATGHVSARDHLATVRAFAGRGQVLVTHAMEELAGPALGVQECVELAELGAFVELCAMTCIGHFASRTVADIAACVGEIGAARCTLGTDYGQATNPRPAAGFQAFADALVAEGLSEQDIRRMACDNPRQLLQI